MFERRSDRRAKGPGTPVPPTLLCAAGFLGGIWCQRRIPWPMQAGGSDLLMAIGLVFAAIGLVLFGAGLLTFARAKTGIMLQRAATSVVTSGPYRWSRNPQYVGFVSAYLGASLIANTLWPLIFLPLVILALNRLVIAREERYMERLFDASYQAYTKRVPRWL
jgi:protein-S-isoprenylcysteine O-methyltransferase Ste14